MKKLIVFLSCQRSGSSLITDMFSRHGMSLGNFNFFEWSDDQPYYYYEILPVWQINQSLHQIVYGFDEDALDYVEAGRRMKETVPSRFDIRNIPQSLIYRGIEVISQLTETGNISGFKQPATALFWEYWSHVFRQCPVEVHPVFILRPPEGIASSYVRRRNMSEESSSFYDLIQVYYEKMRAIHHQWPGNKSLVRYDAKSFQADLKEAIQACGMTWGQEDYDQCFQPSMTQLMKNEIPVDHPVQHIYDQWSQQ